MRVRSGQGRERGAEHSFSRTRSRRSGSPRTQCRSKGASLSRDHERREAPFERPAETALPVGTDSVPAKRVMEAGSPGLKERSHQAE